MCGICGSITPMAWDNQQHAEAITIKMADAIAHRGPDDAGHYIDWSKKVTLGHRRLSIIDIENGKQPMTHDATGITLVFNGEIYNYHELKSELLDLGHIFLTKSDTEVLLASYVQWGEFCFEKLIGMFACAIWDPVTNKLICSRDRIGIKPFYYYWDGKNYIFASEIKSLFWHPLFKKELNNVAIYDYCRYGYTLGHHTVYNNVYKLKPGTTIILNVDSEANPVLSQNTFWSQLNNLKPSLSYDDTLSQLEPLLDSVISSHLMSDVNICMLLSGGIDSTLVANVTSKYKSDISAHNVRFSDFNIDESSHARKVADLLDLEYSFETIPSHMNEDVENIICHFDEPFADASSIAMYYLCQSTSKQYKVCLSGDGGDELFAGYNWYSELLKLYTIDKFLPYWLKSIVSKFTRNSIDPTTRGRMLFSNLDQKNSDRHDNLVSIFQYSWIDSLLSDDIKASLIANTDDSIQGKISAIHESSPFGNDLITNAQFADLNSYLVDDVLVKVDRMSMVHGLEVRVPLLDHRVIELAFSLPVDLKINHKNRKIIEKELIRKKFGDTLTNRKKQGFSVPLRSWLLGDLYHLVEKYLLTNGKSTPSGYFSTVEIKKLWDKFVFSKGKVDLSNNIWLLICFEVWYNNLKAKH